MLKMMGYVSLALAFFLLLLLGASAFQSARKKSLKNRKKLRLRRRVYGVAGLLFLVLGITLQFVTFSPSGIRAFISEESPVDVYTKLKKDPNVAYRTLPQDLYVMGDHYYVRTVGGKVYGWLKQGDIYKKGLIYKNAQQVAGGEHLTAVLEKDGDLILTGAFEYLTYEKDDTYFEGEKVADDCTFAEATDHSLFYIKDGDLWSAGYNAFGKLGDGTTRNRTDGVKILEDCASVSSSETHTLAVDIFGNLYGFGDNSYSEMGNRTTAQSTTPIKLMSGVKEAKAGRYFSIVLTKNGEVYAAGRNDKGQLGTGDNRDYATYKKIMDGVMKIAVNKNSCAALTASGTLLVWGENAAHQLGAGEEYLNAPLEVANSVYDVVMGENSMGILTLDRDFKVTGNARPEQNNEYFQVIWAFGATVPEDKIYRETVVMPTPAE